MIRKLHHVCIVVNNLDESIALFERTIGLKCAKVVDSPAFKHKEAVFKVGKEGEIDLVGSTAPDSSVAEFLKSHGQGVHHICFEVDSVDKEVEAMEKEGVKIQYPHEKEADGKMGYAFINLEDYGVRVELIRPGRE